MHSTTTRRYFAAGRYPLVAHIRGAAGNNRVEEVADNQVRAAVAVVRTLAQAEVAVVDCNPELSLETRNCGKNWLSHHCRRRIEHNLAC